MEFLKVGPRIFEALRFKLGTKTDKDDKGQIFEHELSISTNIIGAVIDTKKPRNFGALNYSYLKEDVYIIPGIPPPIPGAPPIGAGSSLGISVIVASVVNNIPATEAAFSKATRVTLVGSIIPAASIFS